VLPVVYRHRDHHNGLAPLILRFFTNEHAVDSVMSVETKKFATHGFDDWVVLIDYEAEPEVMVARRPVRTRSPED